MKKKIIQLSAVAVLLCALIAALVILQKQPAPEAEQSPSSAAEKIYLIGGAEKKSVAEVSIENESGGFTVKNLKAGEESPQYTVAGRESLPLDSYTLGSTGSNAAAFWAQELIAENPTAEQLKEYGLDKPRAKIAVKLDAGGGVANLEIGGASPGGDGAYVRVSGNAVVYLCAKMVTDPFLKPETDYVSKRLVGGSPQESTFKRLTLSGSDYPEPVVIVETPETATEVGGMMLGTHSIQEPFVADIDSTRGMEPLSALFGLTASGTAAIGDDAETLAKYGLDNPNAVVEMVTDLEDVGSFKISFAKSADGTVYAHKNGVAAVYIVDASSLPWMGLSAFDMRGKMIILPFIDSVSAVEVETRDGRYTFFLSGEGDEMVVNQPGGEPIDAKNFRQFYQTMIAASYSEEVPPDAETPGEKPEEKPILQFTYSYRDGGKQPDTVQFFEGPPRRVYVRLNDGPYYLAQSIYVDRVLTDVKLVEEGQPVKSYY